MTATDARGADMRWSLANVTRPRLVGVRTPAVLLLLGLVAAGCSGSGADPERPDAATGTGCGLVPEERVVGLLGTDLVTTQRGSLRTLRERHTSVSCRSVVRGHPERSVTITADVPPGALPAAAQGVQRGLGVRRDGREVHARLPGDRRRARAHRAGRALAALPDARHRRPADRDWGGDPERALAMSRLVAQRLGVQRGRRRRRLGGAGLEPGTRRRGPRRPGCRGRRW